MSTSTRLRLASALVSTALLVGGCASTLGGTAAVNTSDLAALSSAQAALTTSSSTATSASTPLPLSSLSLSIPLPPMTSVPVTTQTTTPSPTVNTEPTRNTSSTPVPPVPPTTTTTAPPTTTSSARVTTSKTTTSKSSTVVQGVDIDAIVAALDNDPVYEDAQAKAAADPSELSELTDEVQGAWTAGLPVGVALISKDADPLTDVSDAIANKTDHTTIVVSTSQFAVSSKEFTNAQLQTAEDAASSASTPAEAATKLVVALTSAYAGSPTTKKTTSKTTTSKTTPKSTTSSGSGGIYDDDRFQIADGTIACLIDSNTVRCDIKDHTYSPPKNPNPQCEGDYGDSVELSGSSDPKFICISDTVMDPTLPKIPDGGTDQVGNIMCFTDAGNVSCISLTSAHGFFLEKDFYSFF